MDADGERMTVLRTRVAGGGDSWEFRGIDRIATAASAARYGRDEFDG